jgi:hypothetical protein
MFAPSKIVGGGLLGREIWSGINASTPATSRLRAQSATEDFLTEAASSPMLGLTMV